jgi:hypothetical protein
MNAPTYPDDERGAPACQPHRRCHCHAAASPDAPGCLLPLGTGAAGWLAAGLEISRCEMCCVHGCWLLLPGR